MRTRANTSPANNASWIVAIGILAVVIPASEKVAANQVFFAAHGVPVLAWVAMLVLGIAVGWGILLGILTLMHRLLSARAYDIAVSALTLAVAWFLLGNILSRTVFAAAPYLGPVAGLVAAVAVTLLARRAAMGTILVTFAAVAAAVPLVATVASADESVTPTTAAFAEVEDRPSILWIVADELQYPLAFTQDGTVRPELPNLAGLASEATTYTRAYSAANYTDYAVPAMLNGISDVASVGMDAMQPIRAGVGIVPTLAAEYAVVMESPIYSFDCDTEACAAVGVTTDVGPLRRYWDFAKDTAAIAGRSTMAEPFASLFPSLDGKWRDFWSGGDEFGDNAEGNTVGRVVEAIDALRSDSTPGPWFALWHSIRTHAPWVVDRDGRRIYPSRVPVVEGAHMIGAEANQTYTTEELKRIERRLYAASAIDFDRQLGVILDRLRATGQYDNTMVVVTADHGATMTDRADRRVGDDLTQRWSEVAHVPLVVKEPGQVAPNLVTEPRSTGQIAATVLRTAGADPADIVPSPPLDAALDRGPVFTTVRRGSLTPWVYSAIPEVDPWLAEDLTPPDPEYPFAVGVDPALLGASVPTGWVEVPDARVRALPGESRQQVLVVDRDAAACASNEPVGLVSSRGLIRGSVLWEGPAGSSGTRTRGWAIVPRAEDYAFWCRPA